MNYNIIYSERKTIAIKIKDGNVILRVPMKTSKRTIKKVLLQYDEWIKTSIEKEREYKEKQPELTPSEIKKLKKEARIYLSERCEYFASRMKVKYNRILITSAESRFGSCSSVGNINFSYRLMLYPERAREYVVVHELAHLIEMNHSASFYKIVEEVLPDYKERKKLLKNTSYN